MALFKFRVVETRTVLVDYSVEADTLEEARDKAEAGDTTMEVELGSSYDVTDRSIEQELGVS